MSSSIQYFKNIFVSLTSLVSVYVELRQDHFYINYYYILY